MVIDAAFRVKLVSVISKKTKDNPQIISITNAE